MHHQKAENAVRTAHLADQFVGFHFDFSGGSSLIKLYEIYAAILLPTRFVLVFRDRAGIAKTCRYEARSRHAVKRQPRDHRLSAVP
jgi:hypothetical protein